ncbi:siderophore-interacting protein [Corynebacterium singulare]|uniref:Siderophore-interacting protein n=1 Tax=Corynebacterium singulare TaxID=161899 RepID=A0A0B6F1R2_9CORY|nr:siderophore-interacting protein [Corynebacterium singulare]AJI77976.1 siderophore-interacting protein [Corynebacterium singulare]
MTHHRLLPVTLTGNTRLKPRLHRLTFHSPAFGDYLLAGPDEYFGLLMPQDKQEFSPFPVDDANVRATVTRLPDDIRPALRWYTIRKLNQKACTIDVDVVTHGDNGPGSRWIRKAQPGDTAGIYTGQARWQEPRKSQLLLADASALPALWHILEHYEAFSPDALGGVDVVALIASDDEIEDGFEETWSGKVRSLTMISAPHEEHIARARQLLDSRFTPDTAPDSVWVSGEGDLAKAVRAIAVHDWGVPREDVIWSVYWIQGKPRP